ncbi:MAG: UDP-N-acetylmuramoyl-L-alanyl-D-glutamate--2,6-diaminopimelate ligase, partial [Chloroflexi bacterium]|nr:UDP-N-acetylmuramoyl-L-alanyl-D-glutamate--2,6-diaminopimelate ligase [Chloroflexota bacterium]
MLLSRLVSALPKILSRTDGDPDITSIEENSRNVKPGSLFVARRGMNMDGHKYIADAIAHGASAIVVENVGQVINLPYI